MKTAIEIAMEKTQPQKEIIEGVITGIYGYPSGPYGMGWTVAKVIVSTESGEVEIFPPSRCEYQELHEGWRIRYIRTNYYNGTIKDIVWEILSSQEEIELLDRKKKDEKEAYTRQRALTVFDPHI